MEPGESLLEVAARELLEETGLVGIRYDLMDVFSGKDLYYKYPHGDEVYNVVTAFICSEYKGSVKIDEESTDFKFFDIKLLPNEICPPDIPIINKYKETVSL